MRKTLSILFFFSFQFILSNSGACQSIQSVRVSLQLNDVSLREAMKRLESMTSFKFLARAEDIEKEQHITINVANRPLSEVLNQMLQGRGLDWRQQDENIFISKRDQSPSQLNVTTMGRKANHSVHGTIRSSTTGEALIGVTISVAGSSAATVSNEYGFYSLTLPAGNYSLLVSAVGMQPKQVEVSLAKDIELNIALENQAKELEKRSKGAELFVVTHANHVFGSEHPYTKDDLPLELQLVCEKSIEFINGGGAV